MAEARAKRPGGARRVRKEGGAGTGEAPKAEPVCPVALCPIGLALTGIRQVRPEAVEHLLAAARELLLAVRAVALAREAEVAGGPPERLERIDIA